jgi:signal transduction histidine kinase
MLVCDIGAGAERLLLIGLTSVTIALALVLVLLLRRVERLVRNVDDVFVWQHRRRTPVATISGLVAALEKGLENGGLAPEQRRAIYHAINEQIQLFYAVDEPPGMETEAAAE